MCFSEQLMALRRQKGLSQEQLGEQIGVSRQTISKWELGDTTPELEKLIQLSDYFQVSIDMLVGHGKKEPAPVVEEKCPGCAWRYEYKSKRRIRGVPVVHINIGRGIYKATGILAIGTIARGLVSIGMVSVGFLSFGVLSAGLLSLGAFSFGLLCSVGALAAGTVAIGGIAAGILAIGGCAFGVYSIGGLALAAQIAAGGYAQAPIAIGDKTNGQIIFDIHQNIAPDTIREAIAAKYPQTWEFLMNLFCSIF